MKVCWAFLLGALLLAACGTDKVVEAPCREDSQCSEGNLCDDFRCVSAETKACEVVIDGNPILQPSSNVVSFGDLDVPEAEKTITLHNIGNCTLTLFEGGLVEAKETAFGCDLCEEPFPVEIFPGRKLDVTLTFKARGVGAFHDALKILSDDREFPEMRVPLHATYVGTPDVRVTPNPVDFGYVAQGRVSKKHLQITNQGTGTAKVEIQSITLDPRDTQDFSLEGLPEGAVTLEPVSANQDAIIDFELQFHPRSTGQHHVELVVVHSKGEARVEISGNSETPPKLTFNPASIDLGDVPLGTTNTQPLTLVNEGGAPLIVDYAWGGPTPTTDLFATPTLMPRINAGAYSELQVSATATALGPLQGLLILTTNDPARPSVTIPVTANGVPGAGNEVVKIEMTYDNGSDGSFDKDLRDVDMTLEHPYGYVCNEEYPNPANWGNYGTPTWIAFGPKKEPERIVLADAKQDGTYRVMLQYKEDCASIPTELMAGLLGISVDVLIAYLTGGVGSVDPDQASDIIKEICLDHKASNASVRVYVNGVVIHEETVNLPNKGDTVYAVDLVRSAGKFSVQ